MIASLKKLFSRDGAAKAQPPVEYNGYTITPRPRAVAGGWSTEAVIHKSIKGEPREHRFIRADASTTRDAATALIITKAKTLIDQQGEKIFS